MKLDNDFIRQVYYHSLIVTHKPVKYISIDFTSSDGNGSGEGDGSGSGYGNGNGSG